MLLLLLLLLVVVLLLLLLVKGACLHKIHPFHSHLQVSLWLHVAPHAAKGSSLPCTTCMPLCCSCCL
jgi:hypothetical protein